jgi:competence protein ComEA
MPTTGERHALLFLASIAVIGAGVRSAESARLVRALGVPAKGVAADGGQSLGDRALAAQITAVDSARAARASRPTRRSRAAATGTGNSSSDSPVPTPNTRNGTPAAPLSINVNSATAKELERLPRVGPALAARIVQWREEHGPFRSIEDLRHVRGIGPATAAKLLPAVTF